MTDNIFLSIVDTTSFALYVFFLFKDSKNAINIILMFQKFQE